MTTFHPKKPSGMRASIHLAVAASALFLTIGTTASAGPLKQEPSASTATAAFPTRVIVMPRAGLPGSQLDRIFRTQGGKGRKLGQSSLYVLELPANASSAAVAAVLSKNPNIKFAEADRLVQRHYASNDPYLGSAWHLSKIGANNAWDTSEGAGITVAILDTGVDPAHPDLKDRLIPGWNTYDRNSNSADVQGHGTAVAGSAAATTNNGVGVASVAGKARILPIRVTDSSGNGYYSTIVDGLIYAADNGARVANVSFGAAGSSSVRSAAEYMKGKGGLVVISAGNNGIDEQLSQTTSLISVSATGSSDAITSWSSYGNFVSIAAPGSGIYSTNKGGGYGSWNGTSFSSPITAGVIAQMMAVKPDLPNTQIESLLFSTALDLGAAGRDPYYGYGRVDAYKAVLAVASAASTQDTQAPSALIVSPIADSTVSGLVPVNVSASDNVGVARVELKVNGNTVATDDQAPFAFSWDSTSVVSGMASLNAVAIDAAGNQGKSATVSVNVSNATVSTTQDTEAPKVSIVNPVPGKVSGTVSVSVEASDNAGASGIKQSLYIDGKLHVTTTGTSLAYSWNTRKVKSGTHMLEVIATDAAGNRSSTSVQVTK